jgi:aldose 1-epimerase
MPELPAMPEPPTGEQIELSRGELTAVVVEMGGGVRSLRAGGVELLDGYAAGERCTDGRGQVLVPWPNRLRDGAYAFEGQDLLLPLSEPASHNAIHGLVRWADWTADERASDRVVMRHTLRPRDGWPFTLRIAVEYALGDDGLTVRTTATNAGDRPCPYGAGAHPYLTLGSPAIDSLVLHGPGSRWMTTDDRAIPTGTEPVDGTPYDFRAARPIADTRLDTGYADLDRDDDGLARVTLRDTDSGRAVTLWLDAGYAFLMLFTGDTLPDAGRRRRGLGVEPMTCAPNALQTGEGLIALRPGESSTAAWGIVPGR